MAQAIPLAGSIVVDSEPYKWPFDGRLYPSNTALVIIDMQVDFCGRGGYVESMGYDLANTQRAIEPIKKLLALCRELGFHVIHTREGHRPDLSNLPDNKYWRSAQMGAGIGDMAPAGRVLTCGERGQDIIADLRPIPGEPVIDKPGKGSFYGTDFDMILRKKGIRNLIMTGITTDVCVHTTMREANDRGYECVILTDCTGAADMRNHEAAFSMVKMSGGIFGAVSDSVKVAEALKLAAARAKGAPVRLQDLSGRWHSTDCYPATDAAMTCYLQEQDIEVTDSAVMATKVSDGGDVVVKAGHMTWLFEIPRSPETVVEGKELERLMTIPMGSALHGFFRGGSKSGSPADFFWQPARITIVDLDTIELFVLEKGYTGHFRRGGLQPDTKRRRLGA